MVRGSGEGAVVNGRLGNGGTATLLVGVFVAMVGLAYAAVPLYDLFCRVTGYGGTTQVANAGSAVIADRVIAVRFNADVARGMPWAFRPMQGAVELRVGETGFALYRATNPTDRAIVGTTTYNVTPQKAGRYFAKVQCFCFTEQRLEPGETVEMEVQFFIDPEILADANLDDVNSITLSYTMFRRGAAAVDRVAPSAALQSIAQGPATTGTDR